MKSTSFEMLKNPRNRFGSWRLERKIDPDYGDQAEKLKRAQEYISSELLFPADKREIDKGIGLTLSILPVFRLGIALRNASEDAPINDFSRFIMGEAMQAICEPYDNTIIAPIIGVTVKQATHKSTLIDRANVYLDLGVSHAETGAQHALEQVSMLTAYDGLNLPRTSHIRIMNVHLEEMEAAKMLTYEALSEVQLGEVAFEALSARHLQTS